VFDLAGSSGAAASNRDPIASLDANCRQHLEFFEACRAARTGPHVVFSSSRLVYAPAVTLPVNEAAPLAPQSAYAVHKLCIERYLSIYATAGVLTFTVARISNPFGPDEPARDYGFVNALIARARAGLPLRLFGDGRQLRDYIYIPDLVDALTRCAGRPAAVNETFNIGSGFGISMATAARRICERAASVSPLECLPWPAEYARVESGDYVADISKAVAALGYVPRFGFDAGLVDMFSRMDAEPLAVAAIAADRSGAHADHH
jgi:nucleoside-diphosphate-sugar epimerase